MIEITESLMIYDLAENLFWHSDCNSETEEYKKECSEQLYAQMIGWA